MLLLHRTHLLLFALLLSAVLSGGHARAALPDPTRPPPGLGTATTLSTRTSPPPPPVFGEASAAPRMRPAPAAAPPTPRVQALQLPTGAVPGSATALVDGRLLRVGDRLGDATVQEIRSDGVWLRLPRGGTQWLGLFAPTEPPASTLSTDQNTARKEP